MVKAVQTSVQGTSRSTTDMTLQCADHGMRSEHVAQIPTIARVCVSLSEVTLLVFEIWKTPVLQNCVFCSSARIYVCCTDARNQARLNWPRGSNRGEVHQCDAAVQT